MKKLFSLLMMFILAIGVGWAADYVKVTSTNDLTSGEYLIVCENNNVAFNGGLTTLDATGNYISVTISGGKIASSTAIDGATFTYDATAKTLKSASGYYIGKTATGNGLNSSQSTAYTNTITFDSNGNAVITSSGGPVLRYNNASNQKRFRYYGSGQQAVQLYKKVSSAPTITGTTPFKGSTEVTITAAEGAEIRYNTRNVDPDPVNPDYWVLYEEPFTITETTTVKAVAVLNNQTSDVATKLFEKMPSVASIDEFIGSSGTKVFANPVTVIGQTSDKKSTYVQDGSNRGLLIYNGAGIEQAYSFGDVIPAGFYGSYSLYKSQHEMANATDFAASTETATLTPLELTPSQVSDENFGRYAVIKGATISSTNIEVGTQSVAIYNCFTWTAPTDLTKKYDIYGISSQFNGGAQFIPLSFEESTTPSNFTIEITPVPTEGQVYKAPVQVTITPVDGAGEVEIYYTTDGTDPINGTLYTAPFTIEQSATVKAYAVDDDGNEATAEQAYTINIPVHELPYTNTMAEDNGDFSINNVDLGGLSYVWKHDTNGYYKASAYASGSAHATESWLISPKINLGDATNPVLSFSHVVNKFTDLASAKENATLWIREQGSTQWNQLTIPDYSTNSDWTFVDTEVAIADYIGKTVEIGFKYTSTTNNAGTWEIKNFKVEDVAAEPDPETPTATVSFTPAAGEVERNSTVTLALDGDADGILYTTDGTDPTSSSAKYTAPVAITQAMTIKAVAYNFSNNKYALGTVVSAAYTVATAAPKTLPYEESFNENLGDFVIDNVTLPEGLTYVWSHGAYQGEGYAQAKAYANNTNYEAESWLISPQISIKAEETNPVLTFKQAGKYFTNATTAANECTLWIREVGGEWTPLTIPNNHNNNFTFVDEEIKLTEYAGKTVELGFKYTSTETKAGTWEVKNFKIENVEVDPGEATYYVAGNFTDWENGKVEMTKNDDGTFSLTREVADIEGGVLFKIVKVVGETTTWLGGETQVGESTHGINGGWHTNIPLVDGSDFIIAEGGNITFTVNITDNGETLTVDKEKALFIRGTFNEWAKQAMTKSGNNWTYEAEVAAGTEFKFTDEWGTWYGGNGTLTLGENYALVKDGGSNIVLADANTYTFTVDAGVTKLVVDGPFVTASCFKLVTSTDELVAGKQYIIVGENATDGVTKTYAINTTVNTDNRRASEVESRETINGNDYIDIQDDMAVFVLGGEADAWTFYDGKQKGYLQSSTEDKNRLNTNTFAEGNAEATITIGDEGTSVVFNDGYRKTMRFNYNGGNPLFACYASNSTGNPVTLWVEAEKPEPVVTYGTLEDVLAGDDVDAINEDLHIGFKGLDDRMVYAADAEGNWIGLHMNNDQALAEVLASQNNVLKAGTVKGTAANLTTNPTYNVTSVPELIEGDAAEPVAVNMAVNFSDVKGNTLVKISAYYKGEYFSAFQSDYWGQTLTIDNTYMNTDNLVVKQRYNVTGVLRLKGEWEAGSHPAPRKVGVNDSNYHDNMLIMPTSVDIVTGVDDINVSSAVGVKYYNVAGVASDKPFDGMNIVVTRNADGTSTVTKVVF